MIATIVIIVLVIGYLLNEWRKLNRNLDNLLDNIEL